MAQPSNDSIDERAEFADGGRARLGPAEAAIFETFIVPRYLSLFGEFALEMLVESDDAQVVAIRN